MTARDDKIIFVSWEYHRRTENLAQQLGVPWECFASNAPRWRRHPQFLWRTLRLLFTRRPEILIVQNPSAFLTILGILLKRPLGFTLVVDAHNAGVYPFEPSHEKFGWVFPLMHKHADLTIVTNETLATIVRRNGGKPFILPDALPEMEAVTPPTQRASGEDFEITFICTFASDEPYREVFRAAASLPEGFVINVTGNSNNMDPGAAADMADNTRLTGFLPEAEYVALLCASDAIMDLTTFDDCLVCGAYESVALGVPMILSDTTALRTYFHRGAVYAENNAAGLAAGMLAMRESHEVLREEIRLLHEELTASWDKSRQDLQTYFGTRRSDS